MTTLQWLLLIGAVTLVLGFYLYGRRIQDEDPWQGLDHDEDHEGHLDFGQREANRYTPESYPEEQYADYSDASVESPSSFDGFQRGSAAPESYAQDYSEPPEASFSEQPYPDQFHQEPAQPAHDSYADAGDYQQEEAPATTSRSAPLGAAEWAQSRSEGVTDGQSGGYGANPDPYQQPGQEYGQEFGQSSGHHAGHRPAKSGYPDYPQQPATRLRSEGRPKRKAKWSFFSRKEPEPQNVAKAFDAYDDERMAGAEQRMRPQIVDTGVADEYHADRAATSAASFYGQESQPYPDAGREYPPEPQAEQQPEPSKPSGPAWLDAAAKQASSIVDGFARRDSKPAEPEPEPEQEPYVAPGPTVEPSLEEYAQPTAGSEDNPVAEDGQLGLDIENERPAEQPARIKNVPDGQEKIVILHVRSKDGKPFEGPAIHSALQLCRLKFGMRNIYHRVTETNGMPEVVFSVASMVKPGYLDPVEAKGFTTPGLTFFMVLPGPIDGVTAFRDLLNTADKLALRLQGEVLDENRARITHQTAQFIRDDIAEIERQWRVPTKPGKPGKGR